MPEDGDSISVRVDSGKSAKDEEKTEAPSIKANSSPIMAAQPDADDNQDDSEEEQVVVSRVAQKVIKPLSGSDDAEAKPDDEKTDDEGAGESKEQTEDVAETEDSTESPSAPEPLTPPERDESNMDTSEDRKTVADMSDHTQTMAAHKTRDYKITPSKLKKSPARRRSQNLGTATTIIFFVGIIAIVVGGLWVFMPGFSDSLLNLFDF